MAVEKLIMMNVVGRNAYVDEVMKDILFFEDIQLVDAYNEIENFRFNIGVTEKHMDKLLGFSEVRTGLDSSSNKFANKIQLLNEVFEKHYQINKDVLIDHIDIEEVVQLVNSIYDKVHQKHQIMKLYEEELEKINNSISAYGFLSSANIEMEKINNLGHFDYVIGTLSSENVARLKNNYNNITAIGVHVGTLDNHEVYIIISPKDLSKETSRILKSLNFHQIEGIDPRYTGKPVDIINWLEGKKAAFEIGLGKLEKEINILKEKYKKESNYCYNVLRLYEKISQLKQMMAFSKEHFYFSGWIPIKRKKEITNTLSKYEDITIVFNEDDKNPNIRPPTKLRNNWLFKPFESLIKMYGVPSYTEIDPTPFLSITYLFLFGFMFGDVGQGFVFLLAGVLGSLKGIKLAPILSRLGISSMFFGVLYGSFFGFENVIPAMWMSPLENINTLLIIAIGIGVLMITVGYIYGILNKYRAKDYYNAALSQNGITGLVLYFCIILVALALFTGNRILSLGVLGAIILLTIVILFLRKPIISYLSKRKRQKLNGAFFVESFFEVFEILLSNLSNTLSYIRIGAFALNHVGLFLAFESLAHMANSGIGSIIVYIIGNIFIIGLEGLIVAIQALRLEYYELFSKYFIGGGEEFDPVKL